MTRDLASQARLPSHTPSPPSPSVCLPLPFQDGPDLSNHGDRGDDDPYNNSDNNNKDDNYHPFGDVPDPDNLPPKPIMVQEPDTFDRTDPCKLQAFLVQCKLNFQDHPCVFQTDKAKVTFSQSYLKGMALEWFEPNLLQMGDPTLCLDWMDDYQEFIFKLQTNFGPHDPIGDAEHQLDHLS
ncbi:hypothetical protein PAXRUDRAFT_20111 [Paxillus rubicundulus Ve08.2h10]|uniref:DUF4939 domain-containing protein n=1 Tax=Paxillus rubicundulus Ve08.2h10 TaxID=930991 RepID=A0A0D0DAF6_9AGAM|nr:hypothetical protein PAXRUDRAFT_20111 [Paxillus rubicundulus Ve08.2h10]